MLRFRPAVCSDALVCYLAELYVAPESRGRGPGRALMEAAIEVTRDKGADHIDLGTSEDDVAAHALYESLGFNSREGKPNGPVNYFSERRPADARGHESPSRRSVGVPDEPTAPLERRLDASVAAAAFAGWSTAEPSRNQIADGDISDLAETLKGRAGRRRGRRPATLGPISAIGDVGAVVAMRRRAARKVSRWYGAVRGGRGPRLGGCWEGEGEVRAAAGAPEVVMLPSRRWITRSGRSPVRGGPADSFLACRRWRD